VLLDAHAIIHRAYHALPEFTANAIAAIESVFDHPVVVLPDKENEQGEQRFRAIGSTSEGRKAFIVFTWRNRGKRQLVRPISARYMHKREVKNYEKDYPDV